MAILLVTTTGEIMFKGILAPTMPTFCYHVRVSWEPRLFLLNMKWFDDLMFFFKTKGQCKDIRGQLITCIYVCWFLELVP